MEPTDKYLNISMDGRGRRGDGGAGAMERGRRSHHRPLAGDGNGLGKCPFSSRCQNSNRKTGNRLNLVSKYRNFQAISKPLPCHALPSDSFDESLSIIFFISGFPIFKSVSEFGLERGERTEPGVKIPIHFSSMIEILCLTRKKMDKWIGKMSTWMST